MPVSDLDLVRGGLADFRVDNLRISKHAIARARERHIPLEDLRRTHGNEVGRGIQVGNTIVTAITNAMTTVSPTRSKIAQARLAIQRIGVCPSLKTHHPASYTFFRELFQNHPEANRKRVAEIEDISLRKFNKRAPAQMPGNLQFVLQYPDGTRDTISWKKCI